MLRNAIVFFETFAWRAEITEAVLVPDLFDDFARVEALDDGAVLLRGFAADVAVIWDEVRRIVAAAPLRHLMTPGGQKMSVGMTNCGSVGWVSDRRGYRYEACDPLSGASWPAMPGMFLDLAARAAAAGGFADFTPDACLINRYEPGARMGLHIDHDEHDFTAPIVSVSLGLPAVFLWGGKARGDKARRFVVESGDVVVWGGPSRRFYHGVAPLKPGVHELLGPQRFNLTFRKAL